MAKIPIALQLYSVRGDMEKSVSDTLKAVADMGYDGVEFAGYFDTPAPELKKMLDDNGLRCAGSHLGIDTLLDDELDRTADFNAELDNTFLIVPGLPENYRESAEAWRKSADVLNGISTRLESRGMFTGYHNHNHEFTPMDGKIPWEIMFDNTEDRVVMQIDTGNAAHGGADVIPYIEKYPGRARTVHLKEFSAEDEAAVVGQGQIDWQKCFDLCESIGNTEWYIVEQESYAHEPLECVRLCLEYLRGLGK